uniref:Uncharacterized protein n=1 Tax=Ditylenchus dipsaci TaxID=166011 RepID=A0A915D8J6_9BILA
MASQLFDPLIFAATLILVHLNQPVHAQCGCCCDDGLGALGGLGMAGLAGLCPPGLLGAAGLGGLGGAGLGLGLGGLGGLGRRKRQAVNCPHCGTPCAGSNAGAAGTSEIFHLNFDDVLVKQKVSTIAPPKSATGAEIPVIDGQNLGTEKILAEDRTVEPVQT